MSPSQKQCCMFQHGLGATFLALSLVVCISIRGAGACGNRDLKAYTGSPITFSRNWWNWRYMSDEGGYDNNLYCTVLFEAYYEKDVVKLEVTDCEIEPRDSMGNCLDKVTVYDGSSNHDPKVGEFCGNEKPTFESSGRTMFLVFQSNGYNPATYKGFRLDYSSLDRGGFDAATSSSVGVGTIVAAVIPGLILYIIIFAVAYRRCKYAQRVRRNLAATGHTPEDLRMAMMTMVEQAHRGPLDGRQHGHTGNNHSSTPDSHHTTLTASGLPARRVRVRHPAGDIHPEEDHQLHPPLYSSYHGASDDNCSGYGSDRDPGHFSAVNGVADHHISGNGTAGHSGIGHNAPLFPPDPTGIYYAGSVDEHGILHPPGSHSHSSLPTAPTPSVASSSHTHSHLPHHLEEDRRSRGSNRSNRSRRSPYTSGRDSPREVGSHGGSSGHGSPYRHRSGSPAIVHSGSPRSRGYIDPEGQTYTFYGMIDNIPPQGTSLSGTETTDSCAQQHQGIDLNVPPPSYEDAATGKYSPHLPRDA